MFERHLTLHTPAPVFILEFDFVCAHNVRRHSVARCTFHGNYLVCVHVGLSTGTRLPHVEREVSVQLAADDLIRHFADDFSLFGRQLLQVQIGKGSRLSSV